METSIANSERKDTRGKTLSSDEIISFIFSSGSLSKERNRFSGGIFRLLSDIEILNLMKSHMDCPVVSEYFSRDERKTPIWKSSEEFLYCLDSDVSKAVEAADQMAPLISFFKDIDDITDAGQIDSPILQDSSLNERHDKETIKNIINVLLGYKSNTNIYYVILPAKNTFYARIDANKLYIRFDNGPQRYATYQKLDPKDFLDYL